jgi:hypothetical protein
MKPTLFALFFGVLWLAGCSNQSDPTGPQAMPVELSVYVVEPLHPVNGATVIVANMKMITDTSGFAIFQTDINVLLPNHTYQIYANRGNLIQAFPEADTVIVPSAPNTPTGYFLEKTVQMKPLQEIS